MKITTVTATVALALSMSFFVQGCAHNKANEKLDQKVAEETDIQTRADLRKEADQSILNASNITESQKSQLLALRESVRAQMESYQRESLRLSAVLVKTLVAPKYDKKEVELVKSRIKKSEDRKLSVYFDAIEKANRILGRQLGEHSTVVGSFFDPTDASRGSSQ